jgi:hypothetical protein
MTTPDVLFAYISPDVVLPVASALAAVMGFLLMIGRAPFRLAARGFRSAARGVRSLAKPFVTAARAPRSRE